MSHAIRRVFAERIGLRHVALIALLPCMLMIVWAVDAASHLLFRIEIFAVNLHLEV